MEDVLDTGCYEGEQQGYIFFTFMFHIFSLASTN